MTQRWQEPSWIRQYRRKKQEGVECNRNEGDQRWQQDSGIQSWNFNPHEFTMTLILNKNQKGGKLEIRTIKKV